ncbi:MAG: hypothetical protein Ta2A_10990 [Treponemataceae bacterium]|nr:MAG: hypothetical protein Ta2A_10990 [Treponemataceae bacterium]
MDSRLLCVCLMVGTLGLPVFAGGKKDTAATSATALVAVKEWNFDAAADTDGFRVANGEFWQYVGNPALSYDGTSFGSGMLQFELDFSPAANQTSWSEVKFKTDLPEAVNLGGVSRFTFDLYFNPAFRTKGGFQTKVFANNGIDANGAISTEGSDAGNGFVKTVVTLDLTPSTASISDLTLSIVGSETDYKGPVYIDNIRLFKMPAADAVPVTKTVGKPAVIKSPKLAARVTLVDTAATVDTARLYAYLQAVGITKQVIYGHQNDTHHWRGASYTGSTQQGDTKDITGSIAGIAGIDSLSFTGAEYPGNSADADADAVTGSAKLSIAAAKQGALITLSTHMPNFDAVSKKPKLNGTWDFSG